MTITVDIRPEVRAELARQAAAHGRAVEAYVAGLIEEAVRLPAGARRRSVPESYSRTAPLTGGYPQADPGSAHPFHTRESLSGS
jgi:hypothetical protein